MYDLKDTICALSSPPPIAGEVGRCLLRISGSQTWAILDDLFVPAVEKKRQAASAVVYVEGIDVDATVYLFCGPNSYTGEDLAEIHVTAAPVLVA